MDLVIFRHYVIIFNICLETYFDSVLFEDILLVSSKFQFYRDGLLLFGFMLDYGILFIEYGLWILNLMEWLWFDYEILLRIYERKDEKKL